jgi:ABC-type nitrate/sulfonate/bicarbonate transport system permease component
VQAPPLWLARTLVLVAFLALLEVAVRVGLINPFFVPPPSEFLAQMVRDLFDARFLTLAAITLYETAVAFLLASTVGVALGFLLWRVKTLGEAYDPLVAALFSSPIVLLYPIFIVLFGRAPLAIIALASLFSVLPIILFTRQALAGVSPTLLKVGASLNLSSWANFRYILLPAAAPTIFTGLRIGLTYILIVVVAMEFILQIGGLGYLVAQTALLFRANELYSGVTLVVLMSAAFIYLIYRAEGMVRR